MTAPNSDSRTSRRVAARLLVAILTTALTVVAVSSTPSEAASRSVTLTSTKTTKVKVGAKRLTSLAIATVTVPALPARIGLQFRAYTNSNGYRARLSIAKDGKVYASIVRVKPAKTLISSRWLGITVKPGQKLTLQATTAGKSTVAVYLRAWVSGRAKPSKWQLRAKDSSKSRIARSGITRLWIATDGRGSKVSYTATAKSYTLAKAKAVGVKAPTIPKPTVPKPTAPPTSGQPTTPALTPPNPADTGVFSIAVIPDTQNEVYTDTGNATRFVARTRWLVANKDRFDLRYALHTGDISSAGWLLPEQFTRATQAMSELDGHIPYAVTSGNHDTEVVNYDGKAYVDNPECLTRYGKACTSPQLVRRTASFNGSFPMAAAGIRGHYEAGKVDNIWSEFEADGTRWLVLTLELWPRKEVVAWAKNVIATHPGHNVIIQTHNYLSSSGSVESSNGGYGATAPTYLETELVKPFPNVKLIFSGHTGSFRHLPKTYSGNKTVSYLGNLAGAADNPVRIVTIDTRSGTVSSTVYDNTATGKVRMKTLDSISVIR